jgi:hypothetical protein
MPDATTSNTTNRVADIIVEGGATVLVVAIPASTHVRSETPVGFTRILTLESMTRISGVSEI